MKIWSKTEELKEGKYLVVRRDGTVPEWPHFVLGARDMAAPAALLAYAAEAGALGYDGAYVMSVRELAEDFYKVSERSASDNADGGPHRKDDPDVLAAMRGDAMVIVVGVDQDARCDRMEAFGESAGGMPPAEYGDADGVAQARSAVLTDITRRIAAVRAKERKSSGEEARTCAAIASELERLAQQLSG